MNSTRSAGEQRRQALGEHAAADVGHHDVGEEQVDAAGVLRAQARRLVGVGRREHPVAAAPRASAARGRARSRRPRRA